MKFRKLTALLLAVLLVLSLAACGKKGNDDMTKPDGEPKNAQEAAAMYKALMDQENAILMENQSLCSAASSRVRILPAVFVLFIFICLFPP